MKPELSPIQRGEWPMFAEQLGKGSVFHDLPVADNQDQVGLAYGGEAVGDNEGGTTSHQLVQPVHDECLGFGVDRCRGLIENEDGRIQQDSASNRQA